MRTPSFEITKEKLEELYSKQGLTQKDIAKIYNTSPATISRRMQAFGFTPKTHWGRLAKVTKEDLIELYCNQNLSLSKVAKIYGVRACSILDKLQKFGISQKRSGGQSGSHNAAWKGGGTFNSQGYLFDYVPLNNPFRCMCPKRYGGAQRSYVAQHRLVMAMHLGRPLESWEIVHHINGVRTDNRLENLELLTRQADHIPYIHLQHRVKTLERETRLLKWQVKELNIANRGLEKDVTELKTALQLKLELGGSNAHPVRSKNR